MFHRIKKLTAKDNFMASSFYVGPKTEVLGIKI